MTPHREAWLPRIALKPSRPLPCRDDYTAAILAVDITGFTRLTDRLAREGEGGVEAIASLLNDRFGLVIDCIHAHQGDVLRFAGDAIVAGWLGEDALEQVRAAVAAGLDIQERMSQIAARDAIELRAGVALGAMYGLHIGQQRRGFVSSGPVMDEAHAAEARARPGNLVVAPSAAALLRDALHGTDLEDGFIIVQSMENPPMQRIVRNDIPDPPRVPTLPLHPELLARYLPRAVQLRLAAGQEDWLAELRPVTVIFFKIPGDPGDAAQLDRALNIGYTIAERYEGSIDKLLCDEKGTSLILAWGLPPFAHEDDPRRALRASLELHRQLAHPAAAAGIATGMAFCGPVGNDIRREYTLIGSVVNLAARLMQAAAPQGILLCDDATAIACGGVLSFQRQPSLKIKGFDAPMTIWQPGSDQGLRPMDLPPMVGHQRAKDRLLDWMQGGEADRLLVVSGPAGSGKSLLIGHALADARALGVQVVEVCVDPLSSDTPLQPWRRLLRLIIKDNEAIEPVLRALIGIEEATGTFSALQGDIDSEQRAARLRFAVTRRLHQAGPLVLCLDQARDLDSASWALLLHVLMEVPLLRVLLGMRPEGRALPSRVREVVAESASLVLEPLQAPELRLLAMQVLAASQVSDDLVLWLEQKTGGNAFFCDQLLKTMLESGAIEVRGGVAFLTPLTGMALPDTIQAALLTRLDRLDPTDQLILKVASVTGNQFSLDLLKALYPISQDVPKLPGRLNQLCAQGLLKAEAPGFHFCHRLVREVAYGLILPSQRRPLHGITARWYTQRPAQAPGMALLAWHHRQAGDLAAALTCLELAAQEALQASACREVLELLTQAREVANAFPVAEIRRGHWEQMAGEAWHALGDLGKSQAHLAQALSLLGFPLPVSPFAFHFSLFKQVLRQVRHRFFPPVQNGSAQALSAAMALERMSENHFFAAEAMDSILCSLWALNLSETVLPSDVQARTLGVVSGILGGVLNFHGAAVRYSERALQLARQLRQPATEAWVHLLWGLYRIGAGDWPEAVARLSQSAEVYRAQGLLRRREECYHHLGWALLCQGEIARARAVYEALRESSLRSGDAQARAWAWTGLAEVDLREGKLPVRLEEALQETQHCEDLLEEGKVLGLAALASLRAQQPDQALMYVDALLLRARQMRLSFYHGGFSAAAEVLEALPLDRPRVRALRRVLWLLSLSQPVARPVTARMEALLATSPKGRRQALERSLVAAQQLQMRYEMAVAQARLRDLPETR